MSFDDSALFHGTYDPVKAREYYLRTRVLTGRRKTTASKDSPGKGGRRPSSAVKVAGKPNRSNTKSRRAELVAQREALEKRLDHLRAVLKKRVAEAKALTKANAPKQSKKGTAPESKTAKAGKSGGGSQSSKDRKPLSAADRSKKNREARDDYEKEKPNTLSRDIEVLEKQIKDVRAKIQEAINDAREASKRRKTGTKPKRR